MSGRVQLLLGVLLLVLFGAWLMSATEWVDEEVYARPKGEAATNNLYPAQQILRKLGATVVRRQALDALPPAGATLVLTSHEWDMFEDRTAQLRKWIEQGGHLVVHGAMVDSDTINKWLPLVALDSARPASPPANEKKQDAAPRKKQERCRDLRTTGASSDATSTLRLCHPFARSFAHYGPRDATAPTQWALSDADGAELLRVGFGRGSVTVLGPWASFLDRNVLDADNAEALTAALQLKGSSVIWFVTEESREPLLKWLWRQAWIAIVLGLLALGTALWRGGVRFGPREVVAELHRRSMAEQVRGTAQFLHRHAFAALHRAQCRALDEAATTHLRRYGGLNALERAHAVAQATGLPADSLHQARTALRPVGDGTRQLELLETARRRLVETRGRPHPSP